MTAYSQDLAGTRKILSLAVKNQRYEHDSVYLIGGEEGKGKSTFELHCIRIVDELKNQETPIGNIARNLKEFVVRMRLLNDREQVALDEGAELASDRQYEGIVRAVKKMFVVMRQKSFIVYICFTNPLKINTYFREDRVKGVFLITKRGKVNFYTRGTFIQIMEAIKTRRSGIKSITNLTRLGIPPDLIDTFPRYNGRLWEDYQARKKENIKDIFEELFDEFGLDERRYSLEKSAKFLAVSPEILKQYLKEDERDKNPIHILPFEWNLTKTKRRIKEADLLDFKIWFEAQRQQQQHKSPHSVINAEKKIESQGENPSPMLEGEKQ